MGWYQVVSLTYLCILCIIVSMQLVILGKTLLRSSLSLPTLRTFGASPPPLATLRPALEMRRGLGQREEESYEVLSKEGPIGYGDQGDRGRGPSVVSEWEMWLGDVATLGHASAWGIFTTQWSLKGIMPMRLVSCLQPQVAQRVPPPFIFSVSPSCLVFYFRKVEKHDSAPVSSTLLFIDYLLCHLQGLWMLDSKIPPQKRVLL